jgi:hypothetical protein
MGDEEKPDKARELNTAIDLVAAIGPMLLTGDPVTGLVAALAVGGKRFVDTHILKRQKKLDESVRDELRVLHARIDERVEVDEFVALYLRARETAARSAREEKLRYIRNFLLHSVIQPTSRVVDKEPYLRLIDDFSAGELEIFIAFCKAASEANYQSLAEFVASSKPAFLLVQAFARHTVGLPPSGPRTAALIEAESQISMALRRFESVALLDGNRSGGVGEPYAYKTNAFTAAFLRFILDPE